MRAVTRTSRPSPTGYAVSDWAVSTSGVAPTWTASIARCDSTANRSQSWCISSHIARSAADAPASPVRPVDVMAGSRLAMLVSFIARADGVLPMDSANRTTSGFLWCSLPNGSRQYRAKATSNCRRVQRERVDKPSPPLPTARPAYCTPALSLSWCRSPGSLCPPTRRCRAPCSASGRRRGANRKSRRWLRPRDG